MNIPKICVTPTSHPVLFKILDLIYNEGTPAQIRAKQRFYYYPTSYGEPIIHDIKLNKLSPEEREALCVGEEREMLEIVKKYDLEDVHNALNDFFEGGDDYLATSVLELALKITGQA